MEFLYANGLSDGLPVTPPTRLRVRRMLQGTAREPGQVLGKMPPSYEEVTVEKLAVCAVMAGCRPVHFRLVIATAEAVMDSAFGLHGVHATTQGGSPVVVVGGPARHECKVNMQIGVAGSGTRANATICRAVKLALQTVGGASLGGTESSTIGNPLKWGLCMAEWEERCPDWEPLRCDDSTGLGLEDSSVTVFSAVTGPVQMFDAGFPAEMIIQKLATMLKTAINPDALFVNHCLMVVSPEHYDKLVAGGVKSKADFRQRLWQACHVKVGRKNPKSLPKYNAPESLHVIVAGGGAGKFSSFMPGFGFGPTGTSGAFQSIPITKRVDPPVQILQEPEPQMGDELLLDPRPGRKAQLKLAVRGGQLEEGAVVGLLDISKFRSDDFLDALEREFKAARPGVELRRYRKATMTRPCQVEVREQIEKECSHVIAALAD